MSTSSFRCSSFRLANSSAASFSPLLAIVGIAIEPVAANAAADREVRRKARRDAPEKVVEYMVIG